MKMYQLIEWFQINYPQMHQDLLQCDHNFDEKNLNPYHLESDCWSHTMMVCKVAQLSGYDKVVQVAALLHDIGKPIVRNVNPKKNHVQFFGHEELSAEMSKEILQSMVRQYMITEREKKEIFQLILHHSFLHKNPNIDILIEYFGDQLTFCKHLVELSRCDTLGRFSADIFDDEKHQLFLDKIESKY